MEGIGLYMMSIQVVVDRMRKATVSHEPHWSEIVVVVVGEDLPALQGESTFLPSSHYSRSRDEVRQ
jgi:hypothetical protein